MMMAMATLNGAISDRVYSRWVSERVGLSIRAKEAWGRQVGEVVYYGETFKIRSTTMGCERWPRLTMNDLFRSFDRSFDDALAMSTNRLSMYIFITPGCVLQIHV
uniref:Uncharacterized protein n=1 Tax=Anopheles maculatus TaxID=74869 RepID=A0A182S6C3_9DIPT